MEEKILEGLKYLISYPKGFDKEKKYPLVILLHGAGSREETTKSLRAHNCLKFFWSGRTKEATFFLPRFAKEEPGTNGCYCWFAW